MAAEEEAARTAEEAARLEAEREAVRAAAEAARVAAEIEVSALLRLLAGRVATAGFTRGLGQAARIAAEVEAARIAAELAFSAASLLQALTKGNQAYWQYQYKRNAALMIQREVLIMALLLNNPVTPDIACRKCRCCMYNPLNTRTPATGAMSAAEKLLPVALRCGVETASAGASSRGPQARGGGAARQVCRGVRGI